MNTNKWRHDETYPLSYSQMTKYYFDSKGKANTSKGDGILTTTPPAKDSPADIYVYDPGDPTLNPSYFERTEEEDKVEKSYEEKKAEAQGYHEQVISTREDILVYQTPVLETPLTFAGPIEAVLYASSSAKDTDWFVRLVWNTADGKNHVLCEGKIRARFRESMKEPKMLKPGEVYEYHIDVWQTGVTIPTGDRLRVQVSSASFPMFSRNLNTGGHNEKNTEYVKATQKIIHNEQYPSHIILPVIPGEKLQAIMR